jgi:hypothetical protein
VPYIYIEIESVESRSRHCDVTVTHFTEVWKPTYPLYKFQYYLIWFACSTANPPSPIGTLRHSEKNVAPLLKRSAIRKNLELWNSQANRIWLHSTLRLFVRFKIAREKLVPLVGALALNTAEMLHPLSGSFTRVLNANFASME